MVNRDLHGKIVKEILPRFAEKLKNDKLIIGYDCHPFSFSLIKGQPPITVLPDLVVYLPNNEKALIEIANPRDPKRFLGEIVYPQFLFYHKKISKCIIFVLHSVEQQKVHDRGFDQNMMLHQIFREQGPVILQSWSNEDTAYHNLKYTIESNFLASWMSQEDKHKQTPEKL